MSHPITIQGKGIYGERLARTAVVAIREGLEEAMPLRQRREVEGLKLMEKTFGRMTSA